MGYLSTFETIIIDMVKNHNGIYLSELHELLIRKKQKVSIHSLRTILNKLVEEKKLVKTGIHQFKYYPYDSEVVKINTMWRNAFKPRPF